MFEYSDPTGTGALAGAEALSVYRRFLHADFRHFGKFPNSGFTIPEAFAEVADPANTLQAEVKWLAFPRSSGAANDVIDRDRFRQQDEYVEWQTERDANGRVLRVTFTTEFAEYYEALAAVSGEAVLAEIHRVTGSNAATLSDVFGPNFNPANTTPEGRGARLRQRAQRNPWNNGARSILFLTHPASTLGALLALAAACGVPKTGIAAKDMCAAVSGACVPSRNSDPAICTALNRLAINQNSFTFVDPVGVTIDRLEGIWKRAGKQIDINESALWTVSRNRRRAVLEVPADLTLVDSEVDSGAAVAARLTVGAAVIFAQDSVLPEWSRMGQESSRMLTD